MVEVPEIHEVADNSEFQLDDDYSLLFNYQRYGDLRGFVSTNDVLEKYTTEAVELLRKVDYGTFAAEGKGFYPVSAA